MGPCILEPLPPSPRDRGHTGRGRQPPALSINSQDGGRAGREVRPEFQQNQLEARTGRGSQVVLPGPAPLDPAADHPQPPEAHSPPGKGCPTEPTRLALTGPQVGREKRLV